MNSRAQAGLEYLMTYGWALILVATIITVLVFVVGKPGPSVVFNVSDPTKFLMKDAGISGNTGAIVLQNATGGKITIKSISFLGNLSNSKDFKLNGNKANTLSVFPIDVIAGGEIRLEGMVAAGNGSNSAVAINYTDAFSFSRQVIVSSGIAVSPGLIAYYRFDEGEGAGTADNSGNQYHASNVSASPPTWALTGCPMSSCGKFAGATAFQYFKTPPSIKPPSEGSMGMWIKAEAPQRVQNIYPAGFTDTLVFYGPGGGTSERSGILARYAAGGSNYKSVASGGNQGIYNGGWHHYFVTWNCTTNKGYLFVDGAEKANSPIDIIGQTPCSYLPTVSSPFNIGSGWSDGYGPHNGLIDEVMVFNRALGSGEICSECKRFAANVGVTCNC
jgi:hypothetical protein